MTTHPKNAIYIKRWKDNNRDKYLAKNRKSFAKYYYYKKQVMELLRIDPTLFS